MKNRKNAHRNHKNDAEHAPIDLDALRDLFGNDPDCEKKLFDIFFSTSDESLEHLESALKNKCVNQWRNAAHKISGSAANMRAKKLAEICAAAEKNFDHGDTTIKRQNLNAIQKEINAIKTYMKFR
ncbi:MAG: hypothetical protein COB76_03700 [Alphaproteobacteria bacterium]|nr:MAG: hypothetical protein COB76_03700 [Alphaproteobacteria bacterium]